MTIDSGPDKLYSGPIPTQPIVGCLDQVYCLTVCSGQAARYNLSVRGPVLVRNRQPDRRPYFFVRWYDWQLNLACGQTGTVCFEPVSAARLRIARLPYLPDPMVETIELVLGCDGLVQKHQVRLRLYAQQYVYGPWQ